VQHEVARNERVSEREPSTHDRGEAGVDRPHARLSVGPKFLLKLERTENKYLLFVEPLHATNACSERLPVKDLTAVRRTKLCFRTT